MPLSYVPTSGKEVNRGSKLRRENEGELGKEENNNEKIAISLLAPKSRLPLHTVCV